MIVAGERAGRPGRLASTFEPRPPIDPESDPFLRGTRTGRRPRCTRCAPDGGAADTPGWKVRVVPNLYPALEPQSDAAVEQSIRSPPSRGEPGSSPLGARGGAHEVIVNSPLPVTSLR